MNDAARQSFGEFLRSRRGRLSPEAAGVASGRRRRTPGLRREEVAERAGIGVDWYIRLEQGRMVSPSAATVDALARALKLDKAEHAHLRALAQTSARKPFVREDVPEGLRRIVESLAQPAYLTGRRWDVLAWNAAAADAFVDFGQLPEDDRNILVFVLTDGRARSLFGPGWAQEAKRIVDQFRTSGDLWAGDPAFTRLIDRLSAACPEFDGWWARHDVRAAASGRKRLHHAHGRVADYDYATFQANEDPALKLAVYAAV